MDDMHKALYGGSRKYGKPILVSIYNILGVFMLIVAGVGVFQAFSARESVPLEVRIPAIAAGVGIALVLFGLAQVVDYIGRTAYNTGQARDDAIVEVLTKIEAHLAAAKERREA